MVRLGLISDSHGRSVWVKRLLEVAKRERYDAVFHMGDGAGDARWLEARLDCPIYFVSGNCDMWSGGEDETVRSLGGHTLLAVHGHWYDVKYGLERLSYHAEERGADIALYGHTHDPAAYYVGPVLMINPGALMDGRYAELTLDGKRILPVLKSLKEETL